MSQRYLLQLLLFLLQEEQVETLEAASQTVTPQKLGKLASTHLNSYAVNFAPVTHRQAIGLLFP